MSGTAFSPLRQAIILLGAPGSGSTEAARVIELLGAGTDRGIADSPSPIVAFSGRILHQAGRSWSDPKPLPAEHLDPRRQPAICDHAAGLLRDAFRGDQSLIILADPQVTRLQPLWAEACRRAQVQPLYLLLARNPVDAAASLQAEHGMDAAQAQLLWLAHMLAAEEATRPHPRAVLQHDSLMADWRAALLDAYGRLGCDAIAISGEGAAAVDEYLGSLPEAPAASTTDDLLRNPAFSALVKDLYCDLRQASSASHMLERERWHRARDQLQRAWAVMSPGDGPSRFAPAPIAAAPATPAAPEPAAAPAATAEAASPARPVILHYHLFKNAGTSLDHALKAHFGDAWHEQEGAGPGWRAAEIGEFIAAHPEIKVLSTHTGLLPVPSAPGAKIYPLIFLRHPLDRIRSIYDFESKQVAETEGARVARNTDLKGYVAWRVARKGDRAIRDFQTYRLAMAVPPTEGTELERARMALEMLPFVGVVERFNDSLARFEDGLKAAFPGLALKPTKANVTQRAGLSLEQRLEQLRKELGDELYARLEDANRADMALHHLALSRYDIAQAA